MVYAQKVLFPDMHKRKEKKFSKICNLNANKLEKAPKKKNKGKTLR